MKTFTIGLAIILVALYVNTAYAAPVTKATAQEVQMILVHHGYSLKIDGVYGPKTEKAVRHWQKVNRLVVDGVVGPVTLGSLRDSINGGAPAKRLNPPIQPTGLNGLPFFPGGGDQCEEMVFYMRQVGLPDRFDDSGRHSRWVRSDGFGWRESKCTNTAISPTGCCGGYWQNYISSHVSRQSAYRERIVNECQASTMSDIASDTPLSKQKQACVTKVVYDRSGLTPWD